jgi:hypothetical protein
MEIVQNRVGDVLHVTPLLKNYIRRESMVFERIVTVPDHSEQILAETTLCQVQQRAVFRPSARTYLVTAVKQTEVQSLNLRLNFIAGLD